MSQEVKMISGDEALEYVLKHFEPLEPEQVLAIRPFPELQARVSELLGRSKEGSFRARKKLSWSDT